MRSSFVRRRARAAILAVAAAVAVAGVASLILIVRTGDDSPVPENQASRELPQAVPVDSVPGAPVWFRDVADEVGIDFLHVSGSGGDYYFPEIMIGGVCVLDYDRDGWLDVYFVQGGDLLGERQDAPGNELYRNRGDGTFENVTRRTGSGDTGYGMGCAVADYDGDGWDDIYVTNYGPNVLLRNDGDGTFTDVTRKAGVGDPSYSASAAFCDYDGDGRLDLYVANYVNWSPDEEVDCRGPNGQPSYCTPKGYRGPARDTLYRARADGVFESVGDTSGIDRMFGNALGVVCADFNGDWRPDFFVANDEMANLLWMNQGDGTFSDVALESGAAYNAFGMAEAGMGVAVADVDGDLDLDLYITHFDAETNTLYINDDGFFMDMTDPFGLSGSFPYTGFGTSLTDLNNDGFLDIYVANGRVTHGLTRYREADPFAEPDLLFEGLHDRTFREVKPAAGVAEELVHTGRGTAFADYDNDGGIDIFVVNRDARPYVLHNVVDPRGNWVMFRVLTAAGSYAIGARVTVSVNGRARVADVRPNYGYCSSNDPRVHVGLGDATVVTDVRVRWPDGTEEVFGDFSANQIVALVRRGSEVSADSSPGPRNRQP